MKPIAWICLAATAVVAGTLPTSARACSPSYELIDSVTFDGGAVPDCLDIEASYDDDDQDDYDGNYVLVVMVALGALVRAADVRLHPRAPQRRASRAGVVPAAELRV